MRKVLTVLAVLAISLATAATAAAENYIIGMPADYAGDRSKLETIVSKAFADIHAGETLLVYNATQRQRLAAIDLPADPIYDNMRLRVKTYGAQLRPLGPYFEEATAAPAGELPSNIGIPPFLHEIAETALSTLPPGNTQVLLLGSAKFFDSREPQFSMLEGYFPSDGHLRVDDNISPFGTANRLNSLRGVNIHMCITDTDWIDELHRERVHRFWALYAARLGAKLATFTNDVDTCLQRFLTAENGTVDRFVLDPEQTKPEMLRIVRTAKPETAEAKSLPTREVAFEDGGRFMDEGIDISDRPPLETTGRAKIGIRWDCKACDLDLYTRGTSTSPFLFWSNQVTSEGRHNKDWRNSPDAEKQFEYVDYLKPVNLETMEAYVHFYSGHSGGGAGGVVRIWFDGQVYEAPFQIAASDGNAKATPHPELVSNQPEWVKINILKLTKLDLGQ